MLFLCKNLWYVLTKNINNNRFSQEAKQGDATFVIAYCGVTNCTQNEYRLKKPLFLLYIVGNF